MTVRNRLALAVMIAGVSSQASALELGEVNGTKFSIGGYVKAEGIYDMPDAGGNSFEGSVRQTRLNFAAEKMVGEHKVRGFIEGDFWDNNTSADSTYALRLRHAYISLDNWTVGQTWNGQFFADAPFDSEMINFWGTGTGTVAGNGAVVRPDLVLHYTQGGFRLSLQDPIYSDADFPDLVAAYTHRTASGHAFNIALTGRDVQTGANQSEFGAALSLAGKFKFGSTSLSLSAFTGEGAGVYAGWGFNGAAGASTLDYNTTTGNLITTTGFSVGVTQHFTDKLRGTLRYGQVTADEVAASVADDTLQMTNVNLIYTYMPGLDIGIEWRDQNAATRPPTSANSSIRPKGQQVEIMAMYKF